MTYNYTYKHGSYKLVNDGFTQKYRVQHKIINKTRILPKRCSDRIHDVIPTKYQKYPSTTILKHVNVLAKVNKLPWGNLYNMTSHDAYITTIHISRMYLAGINY